MTLIESLLAVADAYAVATGSSLRLVSDRILADRRRLDLMAQGKADLNTRSFEKAMRWFDENWPAGTPWPAGVERPSPHPAQERRPLPQAGEGKEEAAV